MISAIPGKTLRWLWSRKERRCRTTTLVEDELPDQLQIVPPPPPPNRTRVQNNPIEARRLQTLFRLSKKRTARQILKENITVYTCSKDQAQQYFSDSFATKHIDIDELLESLNEHVSSANEDPSLMAPFTARKIRR